MRDHGKLEILELADQLVIQVIDHAGIPCIEPQAPRLLSSASASNFAKNYPCYR